ELMVTIAIMAIIAMMAAPSFMQQIRRMQLNNDAQEVVQLAIETRSEAIFRKQDRQIILTSNVGSGFKNWQPSENASWATSAKPSEAMTYNFFGYLTGNEACVILEHVKDATLKAVIRFNRNGSVVYDKSASSCAR
ncbi:MAG: prepilin-type cleavage/methylation domain-containing protein, partial [Acinetobacter sp.]